MYNMWRQPITTAIPGEVAEIAEYFDPRCYLWCAVKDTIAAALTTDPPQGLMWTRFLTGGVVHDDRDTKVVASISIYVDMVAVISSDRLTNLAARAEAHRNGGKKVAKLKVNACRASLLQSTTATRNSGTDLLQSRTSTVLLT